MTWADSVSPRMGRKQVWVCEIIVEDILASAGDLRQWTFRVLPTWFYSLNFFFRLFFFRPTPMAYEGSQDRCWIGAAASSFCHSHSNKGSERHLHHGFWQCQIFNPLSEARDWTLILMDSSRVLNSPSHNRNSYSLKNLMLPFVCCLLLP